MQCVKYPCRRFLKYIFAETIAPMNRILFSLFFIFTAVAGGAQNFHGQWKGYFIDKSISAFSFGSERSDYVLDLDIAGRDVTGYSYTYFSDGGKKYYTICTLKGIADKSKGTIRIIETERTKTNVPDNISNSFQVHTLSWHRDGENEILEGTWKPAPGQGINTGYGTTYLAKRQLTEISALAKRLNAKKDPEASPEKQLIASVKKTTAAPLAKVTAPARPSARVPSRSGAGLPSSPFARSTTVLPKPENITPALIPDTVPKSPVSAAIKPLLEKLNFEKRDNTLMQTVNVENAVVKIDLYDSGEVDGDSVSLFYNGKVILAHKMLSEKPIHLDIPIDFDKVNELVMYADNLGTIPPNTALMIVYDGPKRYEVRITSDLKQSGTIRFIHKGGGTK